MKGYKTIAFGLMLGLLSVFSNAEMQSFIAEYLPEVGGSIATIVVILRALTTSSVFDIKDSKGL